MHNLSKISGVWPLLGYSRPQSVAVLWGGRVGKPKPKFSTSAVGSGSNNEATVPEIQELDLRLLNHVF